MSTKKNHALLSALGKRIRVLRLKRAWTQQDLAVHLGISRVHVSDLETGKREAGIIMLQVVARGLDTTMARLLRGL